MLHLREEYNTNSIEKKILFYKENKKKMVNKHHKKHSKTTKTILNMMCIKDYFNLKEEIPQSTAKT